MVGNDDIDEELASSPPDSTNALLGNGDTTADGDGTIAQAPE